MIRHDVAFLQGEDWIRLEHLKRQGGDLWTIPHASFNNLPKLLPSSCSPSAKMVALSTSLNQCKTFSSLCGQRLNWQRFDPQGKCFWHPTCLKPAMDPGKWTLGSAQLLRRKYQEKKLCKQNHHGDNDRLLFECFSIEWLAACGSVVI